jgi:hypothetical protein
LLAKKLVDDEAPKTWLDPVQRDKMDHNMTLANSSAHQVDQDVKVAHEQQRRDQQHLLLGRDLPHLYETQGGTISFGLPRDNFG